MLVAGILAIVHLAPLGASPPGFPATLAAARGEIALVIHSRAAVDLARLADEAEGRSGPRLAGETIGPLFIGAEWVGAAEAPITEDVLAAWGVAWPAVRKAAVARLETHSYELALTGHLFRALDEGLYANQASDTWGPGMLLHPNRIRRLVRGDPVVVVPTPTTILIASANDANALAAMADHIVRLVYEGPTLSVRPLRLHRGRWLPFTVPPGHLAHDAFRHLMLTELDATYERSRPVLQQLAAARGEAVDVPRFHLIKDEAGTVLAVTTLTRGTRALLPRADAVALMLTLDGGEARVLAWARWDELTKLLGHKMRPRTDDPERWEVAGFPTPAQIARLAPASGPQLEEIPLGDDL